VGRPKGQKVKYGAIREDWLKAYKEKGGKKWLKGLSDDLFISVGKHVIPREFFFQADTDKGKVTLEVIIN
jgi:hypothetical protein